VPQAENSRGGQTRARKVKRRPASRSDAAQRTGARTPKPKPAAPPSRRQVAQARAQERQYESQAEMVKKDAARKTRVRKRREAQVRGRSDAAQGGGNRQMREAQQYVLEGYRRKFGDKADSVAKLVDRSGKPAVQADRALDVAQRKSMGKQSSLDAPVLKVLDQTTRPVHAVAAAARKDVQEFKKHGVKGLVGHGSLKSAVKGAKLEDRSLFSDVLKEAGVKNKAVAGAVGFALDVGLDPTTYVTGGAGSVARKAATDAAKSAERKAVKVGLSAAQAKAMGERAARQAGKKAGDGKGVVVRVAGKEVPGVRRASAKAARPVGKAARKVTPARARTGARNVAADVNPNVTPAGVSKETHREVTQATRTARARAAQGRDRAQKRGLGLKRKLSEKDYSRVIDAIESGNLRQLPDELRDVAVRVRSDLRYANRMRKRGGIKGGERKNYVPHQLTRDALEAEGKAVKGAGRKTIKPGYGKARAEQRTLRELREEQPGRYSENLPGLVANRVAQGSEDAARAGLNRRLGEVARPVKRGRPVELEPGEAVYHIKGSDIRKVTDESEIERAASTLKPVVKNGQVVRVKGGNTQGGRYVILSEELVDQATAGIAPKLDWTDKGLVRGYDKTQAGFKRVALATPGYHVRNLVGDSFNAFLGQPGQRLPGNMARSARVLKAAGRRDRANMDLLPVKPRKGTMKTGRYGTLTYDQVAEGLANAGAFRTGFTAKEIPELAQSGKTGVKLGRFGKGRVPQGVKRAFLNREDLPRVATAVEALRRGATWEQAAEYVSQHHFDYQHLTHFERNVARRLAPFYTFTARNIPLQTRKLITNPGKYAQYEKIRQEAAKATGIDEDAREARALYEQLERAGVKLPDGWEKYLTDWEKRNAGVPISWGGNSFTVSFALPLNDLSQVPGAAGKRQLQEYFEKAMSMATPLIKNPTEYFSNYSFFFKDQIQREWSPNVAAPAYVAAFPEALKSDLGVTRIKDKRSGDMVWAWPAKVDYIVKQVPGTPAFAQNMMTGGADRRNRDSMGRVLGFLGVKAVPLDPITNAVNLSYARMDEIAERKGSLNQQGISAEHPNLEYKRLLEQEKVLREIAGRGKAMRGDAVLPKRGRSSGDASSLDVLKRVRKAPSSGGFSVSDYSGSSSGGSAGGSSEFSISSYR
jgi:hypothetical protein